MLFSLFKRDLSEFKVVLGDSNLKLDLPYGVQEHKISKAIVHENYDSNDVLHHNDIGKGHTSYKLDQKLIFTCLKEL